MFVFEIRKISLLSVLRKAVNVFIRMIESLLTVALLAESSMDLNSD